MNLNDFSLPSVVKESINVDFLDSNISELLAVEQSSQNVYSNLSPGLLSDEQSSTNIASQNSYCNVLLPNTQSTITSQNISSFTQVSDCPETSTTYVVLHQVPPNNTQSTTTSQNLSSFNPVSDCQEKSTTYVELHRVPPNNTQSTTISQNLSSFTQVSDCQETSTTYVELHQVPPNKVAVATNPSDKRYSDVSLLLNSWNLGHLYPTFEGKFIISGIHRCLKFNFIRLVKKIDLEAMKLIHSNHLDELLQDIPLGDRIKLRHYLISWQKQLVSIQISILFLKID